MRKVYTKPEIMFESFSLSTNITTNCETKVTTTFDGDCGITWGFQIVFTDSPTTKCTQKIKEDEEWNGICYHNPTEENNLFNS